MARRGPKPFSISFLYCLEIFSIQASSGEPVWPCLAPITSETCGGIGNRVGTEAGDPGVGFSIAGLALTAIALGSCADSVDEDEPSELVLLLLLSPLSSPSSEEAVTGTGLLMIGDFDFGIMNFGLAFAGCLVLLITIRLFEPVIGSGLATRAAAFTGDFTGTVEETNLAGALVGDFTI